LATEKVTELADVMQSAFTYVRERDLAGADLAFQGVAQQARHADLSVIEAEAWRMRARLQVITTSDDLVETEVAHGGKRLGLFRKKKGIQRVELEYLTKAEQALKDAKAIPESDRQDGSNGGAPAKRRILPLLDADTGILPIQAALDCKSAARARTIASGPSDSGTNKSASAAVLSFSSFITKMILPSGQYLLKSPVSSFACKGAIREQIRKMPHLPISTSKRAWLSVFAEWT
jgi:hypothetical protein